MARPPALCAHCGHDVARGATRCGRCSRELVPWVLAPRGELVDVSPWLTVPLGLAIAVTLVLYRGDHPAPHVLLGICAICAALLLALIMYIGEASWTSSVGATAQTFHGRLTTAHGAGTEDIVHEAPEQAEVRGDMLLDNARASKIALPVSLGANRVEASLVAAIMGATARGRIALVETRRRHWKRAGAVRTETPQRWGGTFAITLLTPLGADEDAVAELLIGPFSPAREGDYRGSPQLGALLEGERRTISLLDVVRTAFPGAEKPRRALRRVLPRVPRGPAEREALGALLRSISSDERVQTWIALRDALRRSLALRGRQVG